MNHEVLLKMPESVLLKHIYKNENYLGVVMEKCRKGCVNFLRNENSVLSDEELEEIFVDSLLILLENIRRGNFVLTSEFQTYLISVCKNKLRNIVNKKKSKKNLEFDKMYDYEKIGENLAYSFEDESEAKKDFLERSIINLTQTLENIRLRGGNCYELITLFTYEDVNIAQLTERFGYASAAVTKVQRSKCLKRVRLLSAQIN